MATRPILLEELLARERSYRARGAFRVNPLAQQAGGFAPACQPMGLWASPFASRPVYRANHLGMMPIGFFHSVKQHRFLIGVPRSNGCRTSLRR